LLAAATEVLWKTIYLELVKESELTVLELVVPGSALEFAAFESN
jgi:hypothetical protein